MNDSLQVTKDISTDGDIKATGEVVSRDTMRAEKDLLIDGNIKIGGDMHVTGRSVFEQSIIAKKGVLFNDDFGISFLVSNGINTFSYGRSAIPPVSNACLIPGGPFYSHQFGGGLQIYETDQLGNYPNAGAILSMTSWNGASAIDLAGGASTGSLLINYFCGRNTIINTGWDIPNGKDGGTVFMGAKVDMQNSLKIGYTQSGIIDLNTSIEINQNTNGARGVNVRTWNIGVKAFAVERADGKNTFIVYGDGKTQIGVEKVATGPHANALLSVSGKIACKEVRVFDNTSGNWADFVFDKEYKLMDLLVLEKFYTKNKHLPNIPTAKQVQEEGNDLGKTEVLLLQKVEELTLYIVQQQKEINELKLLINK